MICFSLANLADDPIAPGVVFTNLADWRHDD